jgi:hypothetical protein
MMAKCNYLLIIVLVFSALNLQALAKCSEKDIRGNWAFMFSGWAASGSNVSFGAIGVVKFDGEGQVANGWSHTKVGTSLRSIYNWTGHYTVVDPCNVNVWLNSSALSFNSHGVLHKGKQHMASFASDSKGVVATGEFSKIDGMCRPQSIKGLWAGTVLSMAGSTSTGFSLNMDCTNKTSCDVVSYRQANATLRVESFPNVTYNATWPCRFSLGAPLTGVVGVPYGEGMYTMQTGAAANWVANLGVGAK